MVNQDNQRHSFGLNQFTTPKVQSKISPQNRDTDNDDHSQQDNYNKSVGKSDETILCYNCKNYGHAVSQCNLDAYSYCERFRVGHKSNKYPKRNNMQSKRNVNYGKDETNNHGNKSILKKNQNNKTEANHPKKRGIKRVKSELSDLRK